MIYSGRLKEAMKVAKDAGFEYGTEEYRVIVSALIQADAIEEVGITITKGLRGLEDIIRLKNF